MKSSRSVRCVLAGALALGLSLPVAAAPAASAASAARLVVKGNTLRNGKGEAVRLRGFGLGGMLHLENFIDGYAGSEEGFREALLKALGREKYDLFFETFYENYFTEADARYVASLGLNLIRLYAILSEPFIPDASAKMLRAMHSDDRSWPGAVAEALTALKPGHAFETPDLLFAKIADEMRAILAADTDDEAYKAIAWWCVDWVNRRLVAEMRAKYRGAK